MATETTLGAALRQIDRLFGDGAVTGLSDAQLLERFVARRDVAAFEAILARHGPMVLSVCRGIVHDPNDAEDAFQATFLILVRKAGSIGGRVVLGGWLYRVARRVAIEANVAAARRRARERRAGTLATVPSSGPTESDDLVPALHEEIARLPEKHRLPLVLCDLEGVPQAEAAGQLRWSERTLRRRLAEARGRLKARLAGRGLAPDGAMMGAIRLREGHPAVPPAWNAALVRTATGAVHPAAGAVSVAAQSLAHEVLKTMLVRNLTMAAAALLSAGVMAWAATAAMAPRGEGRGKEAGAAAPVARQTGPDAPEANGTFPIRGRVLDPDGKPVANAAIYVRPFTESGEDQADPVPGRQKGRVGTSGADGRFRFELDKASSDWPYGDGPAWHQAEIAAVAPGLALAWVDAGSLLKGEEATLRLVRDDVPIRGRVVDPQGRPIAGATVRLRQIAAIKPGADPDAMLASGVLDYDRINRPYGSYGSVAAFWPGGSNTWTTDADGRFEVKGIGRDRLGGLDVRGPALATSFFYVMARPAKAPPRPRPQATRRDKDMMFYGSSPSPLLVGATFEHVAGPTKPIVGVVRSKATGRPIAGVRVSGQEGATRTWASAVTDAQGRFRLAGLPKGEIYQVTANQGYDAVPSFLSAWLTVTDTEGLKPIETALELPRGVTVTGRLIDTATGRPVPAQVVYHVKLPTNANPGDGGARQMRPVAPTFRLTVPPGGGMILVQARGKDLPYTRARLRKADKGKGVGGTGDGETITTMLNGCHAYKIVDIPSDAESFTVELDLTRGLSRKGRAVDPDGKPVAGVQCYGLGPTWGEMRTLDDGTFEVRGLEPDHPRQLIFAHKERRLVGSVILKGEESRSDQPLVVRLDRPGALKGRLIDEDGQPLAGAQVETLTIDLDGDNLPPGPGPQAMWPDNDIVTTDAEGRFRIDGLKPGVRTNSAPEFKDRLNVRLDTGKVLRDIVIQEPGEVRDLGDIQVKVVRGQ